MKNSSLHSSHSFLARVMREHAEWRVLILTGLLMMTFLIFRLFPRSARPKSLHIYNSNSSVTLGSPESIPRSENMLFILHYPIRIPRGTAIDKVLSILDKGLMIYYQCSRLLSLPYLRSVRETRECVKMREAEEHPSKYDFIHLQVWMSSATPESDQPILFAIPVFFLTSFVILCVRCPNIRLFISVAAAGSK